MPKPPDEKVSLSGWLLSSATSSGSDLAGTDGMDHQHVVGGRQLDDRGEIGIQPKAYIGQQRRRGRSRQRDRQDRMAVRRLLENFGRSEDRAGLVLDDDAPAFGFGELVRDDAADDVGRRAGGGGADDADHARWVGLRAQ